VAPVPLQPFQGARLDCLAPYSVLLYSSLAALRGRAPGTLQGASGALLSRIVHLSSAAGFPCRSLWLLVHAPAPPSALSSFPPYSCTDRHACRKYTRARIRGSLGASPAPTRQRLSRRPETVHHPFPYQGLWSPNSLAYLYRTVDAFGHRLTSSVSQCQVDLLHVRSS
jgi:hypothetical protein